MHPVLADAVFPLAEQVAAVSLSEAQLSPDPEHRRWCGQQVVEHLLLSFQRSRDELQKRLKSGESPANTGSLLQWVLKTQVCLFGSMSRGVSTTLALRPAHFDPQDGAALASRLLANAEELDRVLSECRICFGLRPCGYHLLYGSLRVEEWRVYHAVHCRQHQRQFEEAIRIARRNPDGVRRSGTGVQQGVTNAGQDE